MKTSAERYNARMEEIFATKKRLDAEARTSLSVDSRVWDHLVDMAYEETALEGEWTSETANARCERYAYLLGVLLSDES